jgi:hypothetical protein
METLVGSDRLTCGTLSSRGADLRRAGKWLVEDPSAPSKFESNEV